MAPTSGHIVEKGPRVDQHPHGHEKDRDEHVPQRLEARQRLVHVVGPADDEARQEGAEGQGQPGSLAQRRRPHAEDQRHDEEQFPVLRPGNPGQEPGKHLGGKDPKGEEDGRGLREGQPDRGESPRLQGPEGRDEDDEDHDREVVHEGDADSHPPVAGVQFPAVKEEPDQHQGARRGDDHAND